MVSLNKTNIKKQRAPKIYKEIFWQVAYACECGNEPSGSVKCGEFLD